MARSRQPNAMEILSAGMYEFDDAAEKLYKISEVFDYMRHDSPEEAYNMASSEEEEDAIDDAWGEIKDLATVIDKSLDTIAKHCEHVMHADNAKDVSKVTKSLVKQLGRMG